MALPKGFLSKSCRPRRQSLFRTFHESPICKTEFGWFNKFIKVPKSQPHEASSSHLLANLESVYELQKEDVQPGQMDNYLKNLENYVQEVKGKTEGYNLVGSFRVLIGDQDRAVNLWRYDGYPTASKVQRALVQDSNLQKLENDKIKLLRKRENQFCLAFSFWDVAEPADRNCFYELRSYILKPGELLDWGNAWAKGIHCRQNRVAGYFSQIGRLYMVYHLWHYDDLQDRQDVRQTDWIRPGWDEILRDTIPQIREMRSTWMVGNKFSPIR